jgi:ATP-dependent 26S proteasome regulatory subunit
MPPVRAARRADLGPAGDFAQLIAVERGWDDIVTTESALAQLRELCMLVPGGGVVAIFHGPPGAGKTLAAEVVARQLRLDVLRVDVQGLVAAYAAAAGRLLSRVFEAADRPNAVIVLDRAEALPSDAAAQVARLAEARRAPTILETISDERLPSRLGRRARMRVFLPAPEETHRRQLWQRELRRAEPTARVDVDRLATEPLTGGAIHRRVLQAAAHARAEHRPVTIEDLAA